MTLRFFRRKPGAAHASSNEPAAEEQSAEAEPSPRSARRRRSGASSASRSKESAKPATSEKKPAAAAKPSTGRSRRGRRGGAARKAKAEPAEAPAGAPEPAPVIRQRAEPETVKAPLARQEAALQQLTERQLSALKGLQGSLSAIENRLAGMDRLAPAAERPRVGIFVDVPNVVYAAERLRTTIDFGKVLEFLVRGRELVRASAYAPISDDPQAPLESQKFVEPFVGLGYRIVTKPWKRYADGSIKANFDVELAIDVLTMSDRLDIVTLVSGDGDFRHLVELVASKGVRVQVVAFGQSTAAELRAVADEYVDINDHLAELRAK